MALHLRQLFGIKSNRKTNPRLRFITRRMLRMPFGLRQTWRALLNARLPTISHEAEMNATVASPYATGAAQT